MVIATPDHWHGVQTVHAAECGKHVYVEKPACCTIEEGKAMVAAANEDKIAVQVGSQGRSQPEAYLAHRYLVNGNIGQGQHGSIAGTTPARPTTIPCPTATRRRNSTGTCGSARCAGGRTTRATATARSAG